VADERRVTIMIVEDDALTALYERETLEAAGYAVVVARTGAEALRLADNDAPPDLALMDIDLGEELDGIQLADALRRTSPLPVVFASAHTDAATLGRLRGVDAYGYCPKNAGDAVLEAAVSMALTRVAAEKAARDRIEAEYSARLTESATRLRESHHRVRNNIASIRAVMAMQMDSAESPETRSALQDAIGRIESMGSLYELLAADDDGSDVAVEPYLRKLVDTITPLFPDTARVSIKDDIDDFSLDPKRLFALGIIVNELLTNAMKYAFRGRDAGSIRIEVRAYDESVIMTLRDDGNGLPESFDKDKSSGLGLSLVSMLLDQFGGTLTMRNDHGTVSTALIKVPGLASVRADAPAASASGRTAVA